jgi:signal transduction histidine kinase/ligand-binding sensor domain-containing protein
VFFSKFQWSCCIQALIYPLFAFFSQAADRMVMQDFIGHNWDIADGLPSARVSALARTDDGYTWLATPKGLTRFDGVRFFNLTNAQGLTGVAVRSLLTRRDGSLWIGSESGTLHRRSGDRFSEVDIGTALGGTPVLTLAEDAGGALWIGTDGAGLFSLKDGITAGFTPANSKLPGLRVSQLTLDSTGHLWFLANGSLCRIENGAIQPPGGSAVLQSPALAITPSRDGGLWVATEGLHYGGTRIFHLIEGKKTELPEPYPWPENSVRSRTLAITEDGSGRLWCATSGGGIFYRSKEGLWCKLDTHMPLSHAEGLCFMLDESDTLWLGTRTSGLHHLRPHPPITLLHLPSEYDQNIIQSVCVRRDGTIWAGTDTAGLFRWTNGEATRIEIDQGSYDPRVNTVVEDSRGNLWVGTMGGLFKWDGQKLVRASSHSAIRRCGATDVLDDGATGIWVATLQGVVHLDENKPSLYFGKENGLPWGLIRTLALDLDDRLLVVISGVGVYRQNGDRFEPLSVPQVGSQPQHEWNAGPSAHVRALLCAADGSLWAGTHGFGLWRLRPDGADQWTVEKGGMPSNYLFGIQDDKQGNFWLGSESGILGIPKDLFGRKTGSDGVSLGTWQLTLADGLASNICSAMGRAGAARSPDGSMLWFTNGTALAGFAPANLARNSLTRRPVIEEVLVDGLPVPNSSVPFHVKSGARTFELHYTSPNLESPERQRFRYQLKGIDRDWVDAENRRVAFYNRLDPGVYEFRVKAGRNDDTWLEAAAPLRFEVTPRFYERPAVKTAAGFFLLVSVGGAAWTIERSRSRRRLERMTLLRAMDLERQRIARDIHDDLGSGLTEIILLSDTLREEVEADPAASKSARAISNSARNLTRAMDEVVWAVNPGNDTLESFLNYINDFAQEFLTNSGVRYRWAAPAEVPDLSLSSETRHSLYLACKEALNNATRHAAASEVHIRLDIDPPGFSISIEDNGKGFEPGTTRKGGRGLGNMHQRLLDIGGRCEIQSNPGGGTKVIFAFVSPDLRKQ